MERKTFFNDKIFGIGAMAQKNVVYNVLNLIPNQI